MPEEIKQRRLNIGEIFKYTGDIYKKNFWVLVVISIGVYLPLNIIIMLLPIPATLPSPEEISFGSYANITPYLQYLYSALAVSTLFTPLAAAAVTHVTRENVEGKPVTFPGILDSSLIKWGKLTATALLYVLAVGLAGILILPGIYFSVLFTFYPNVIATRDVWGVKALAHSRGIVRGKWWPTFGFIVIISILSYFINMVVNSVFVLLQIDLGPAATILLTVSLEIITIFFQIALALWYLNHNYLLENH